jgi:hypothetical protein
VKTQFDDISQGGQPLALVPLIGRTVFRAWILPSGKTLVLGLRGGKILIVERAKIVGDLEALQIEIGDVIPGRDWSDMEAYCQDPHLKAIIGLKFTGLDQNIVMFGDVGAKIGTTGIEWVKVAGT